MFEVILSFFTNTISFLRIGAFAIVHVGMMMVVAILSQSGGVGGVIVQVIGNVLVMVLEGLSSEYRYFVWSITKCSQDTSQAEVKNLCHFVINNINRF